MSLSERAILTHLTISVWSGTVGRTANEEGLDPERDRVIHSVVPPAMLKGVKEYAGALRRMHYRYSAPWDDNGLRLVPSQTLFEYSEKMREYRDTFDTLVDNLLPRLRDCIEDGYADRFSDLRARFGTRLTFYPVPDGDKLPLIVDTVTASVRSSIVESMNADSQVRTAEISRGIVEAIYKRMLRATLKTEDAERILDHAKVPDALADTQLLIRTLVSIDPLYQRLQDIHQQEQAANLITNLERLLER